MLRAHRSAVNAHPVFRPPTVADFPGLEPAVCPHCCGTECWLFTDPHTRRTEVVCPCQFDGPPPSTPGGAAHAPRQAA